MAIWDRFLGRRNQAPAAKAAPAPPSATPPPDTDGRSAMAAVLMGAKRPRFAHMAKEFELSGQFADADVALNQLAIAQEAVAGQADPDLATAIYEIARLNHRHEFQRDPETAMALGSLDRGQLVLMYYRRALDIRRAALPANHPALACSQYGLADALLDSGRPQDRNEAADLLLSALEATKQAPDPLPGARTALRLAQMLAQAGDLGRAAAYIAQCRQALQETRAAFGELLRAQAALASAPAEAQLREDHIMRARARHEPYADPFFRLLFDLLANGQLLEMGLDLHRRQYERDVLATNVELLEDMSAIWRREGRDTTDIDTAARAIRADGPNWLRQVAE